MSKKTSIENYFQKLTQRNPETECDTSTNQPTLSSSTSSSNSSQKSAAKCPSQSQHAKEPDQPSHSHGNSIKTPNQPKNYSFPKTLFGKQYRSVQSVWVRTVSLASL